MAHNHIISQSCKHTVTLISILHSLPHTHSVDVTTPTTIAHGKEPEQTQERPREDPPPSAPSSPHYFSRGKFFHDEPRKEFDCVREPFFLSSGQTHVSDRKGYLRTQERKSCGPGGVEMRKRMSEEK